MKQEGTPSSILSFPDRGKWGDARWRGNCSGHVYRVLFELLKPAYFCDPMVGSGTSVEVAREMGIECVGLDLHSGFNALRMSILEAIGRPADLVLAHPPYAGMVLYSGEVWGKPHRDDLSRCGTIEEFNEKLHMVLLNEREATRNGGYYGVIIGDWRNNGQYHCFSAEMIARMPRSELASVIVKAQHNTTSASKAYGRMRLPRITHEYVVLWMKPAVGRSTILALAEMATQHQMRLRATWRAVVRNVLVSLGGKAPLEDIYAEVSREAPARVRANANWQPKVRQTLQLNREFARAGRGVWALAA